jgi:serine/threonine protein kinase
VQICLALRYLHSRKIIHRDIKSSNIFLTNFKRIKLGDFGTCRRLKEEEVLLSTAGTPSHLPPELFSSEYGSSTGKGFSSKQDMWALGVVLYELCAQLLPFNGYCLDDLISKIKACSYEDIPSEYSINLVSLLKSLLSSNEDLRP